MTPDTTPTVRLVPLADMVGFARIVRQARAFQDEAERLMRRGGVRERQDAARVARGWERKVDAKVREVLVHGEYTTRSMFGEDEADQVVYLGVTARDLVDLVTLTARLLACDRNHRASGQQADRDGFDSTAAKVQAIVDRVRDQWREGGGS